MKASSLSKKTLSIFDVHEEIEIANELGSFKIFIPHHKFIKNETVIQLIEDGFKVHKGDWDGININVTIIEW